MLKKKCDFGISCRTPPGGGGVPSDLKHLRDFGQFLKILSEKGKLANFLSIQCTWEGRSAAGAKIIDLECFRLICGPLKPNFRRLRRAKLIPWNFTRFRGKSRSGVLSVTPK